MFKLLFSSFIIFSLSHLNAQERVVLVKLNKLVDTTVQLKMISNFDTISPYSQKRVNDSTLAFYLKKDLISKDSIYVNFIIVQGNYNYPITTRTNNLLNCILEFEITKIIKRKKQFYYITSYDYSGETGWRFRERR
jgi:hypothetical protein